MPVNPDFDQAAVNHYYSIDCYNRAWDLMDKSNRSIQEDQEMIMLSMTSLWHWTQREDCTPTNLSIGYWQLSRVYALLGQGENARQYARICLECSHNGGVAAFFLGYAFEAMARAEALLGNTLEMQKNLDEAQRMAARVSEDEDREQLLGDLETVR